MRNSSHAINEWVRSALAGLIGVVVSVTSSDVRAQQWIATTPQLKTACETSPGNVVVLNEATTIVEGARYPFSEQVLTGCTIVLGPNAKLATEGVAMRFAGPLVVQSATPTEVKLTRSFLAAASVNFNLPGAGNAIEMEFSHIHATTGGLLFTMGDESKLTVMARILNGPLEAMTAATTAQIRSGRKFSASFSQMRISAPQGIDISQVRGLYSQRHGINWVTGRLIPEVRNLLGSDVMSSLEIADVRGERGVEVPTERTEAEIEFLRRRNPRASRESLKYKHERVGELVPMPWLRFDFKRRISDELSPAVRRFASIHPEAFDNRKLKAELKRLGDPARSVEEARVALHSASEFLSDDNLRLLALWLPERLSARRRAVQQWIGNSARDKLLEGL